MDPPEHYKMKISPVKFIVENEIPFREANVIKYVCRHNKKNGVEDIRKAIHYLKMIEKEYFSKVEEEYFKDRVDKIEQTPKRLTDEDYLG